VANIFTEGSFIENSTEQKDLQEYVIPFTPEDEELVHNLEVLENISGSTALLEERILDGVRVGKESYNIKPTEAYTISSDGRKVFVTGKPGSANRMAFYAYPNSPHEPLDGIDASPYLRVYKVELIMTRKTAKKDVELDWGHTPKFTHSYPQINTDVLFVDWSYHAAGIPTNYYLNPLGKKDTVRWREDDLSFVEYSEHPVVAIGRRNREKFYGDRMTYIRLLRSLQRFSSLHGGLQPKDAYLQLAFTEDEEYESNLVISI
jgi:hypothetical protein